MVSRAVHRLLILAAVLAVAACSGAATGSEGADDNSPYSTAAGGSLTGSPREWTGVTRLVPSEYSTIQEAVDVADPGDLVLVDRGVYLETVSITTPGLVLRGVDRNQVIIDGEFERSNGVEVFFTDGVAVENLTVRNHRVNGVFWNGVLGYRGSYLTAVNNGDYGIYAFDSSDGLLEHSLASGSPDAAFYIGQCNPCDAVVTDVIGEHSGLGYSGTNASGEIYLVNSVYRFNGAGMAPNSLDGELYPPSKRVVVAGNLVYDNGYGEFPHKTSQWATQGNGILLTGIIDSLAIRNRVFNHPLSGIWVHPVVDDNLWMSYDNVVRANVVEGSGLADLTLTGPSGSGNCFEGNEHTSSSPSLLESLQPCAGLRFPARWDMGSLATAFGRVVEANLGLDTEVFYGDMPHPSSQPQMPGGADAPVSPAVDVFLGARPDLDSVMVPEIPMGTEVSETKGYSLMGVTFGSLIGGLVGLYAYILPLALYSAWVVIALWEIIHRDDLARGAGMAWIVAILIVPFLGVIAYYVAGGSRIPTAYRWLLLAGGLGAYLLFLIIGLVVGGVV